MLSLIFKLSGGSEFLFLIRLGDFTCSSSAFLNVDESGRADY